MDRFWTWSYRGTCLTFSWEFFPIYLSTPQLQCVAKWLSCVEFLSVSHHYSEIVTFLWMMVSNGPDPVQGLAWCIIFWSKVSDDTNLFGVKRKRVQVRRHLGTSLLGSAVARWDEKMQLSSPFMEEIDSFRWRIGSGLWKWWKEQHVPLIAYLLSSWIPIVWKSALIVGYFKWPIQ